MPPDIQAKNYKCKKCGYEGDISLNQLIYHEKGKCNKKQEGNIMPKPNDQKGIEINTEWLGKEVTLQYWQLGLIILLSCLITYVLWT